MSGFSPQWSHDEACVQTSGRRVQVWSLCQPSACERRSTFLFINHLIQFWIHIPSETFWLSTGSSLFWVDINVWQNTRTFTLEFWTCGPGEPEVERLCVWRAGCLLQGPVKASLQEGVLPDCPLFHNKLHFAMSGLLALSILQSKSPSRSMALIRWWASGAYMTWTALWLF